MKSFKFAIRTDHLFMFLKLKKFMKNRFLILTIWLLCLLVGYSPSQAQQLQLVPADKGQVLQSLPSVKQMQQRHESIKRTQKVNAGSWAYYEDFEECLSGSDGTYPLPDGWVSVATTGDETDVWHAGAVMNYSTGQALKGADNGYGMGILIGSTKHDQDAWAITPKFKLEAGKEYRVRFYVQFYGASGLEKLKTWLGKEQTVEAMDTCVAELTSAASWTKVEFNFTPSQTEEYCLGFEGLSTQNATAILLDYITVVSGPIFYCENPIAMGATTTLDAPQTKEVYIYNMGTDTLQVSLNSATSPEITVEGLPLTIAAGDYAMITVTVDVTTAGDYVGKLVLNTNNAGQDPVTVYVTESVTESVVTGRWFEDFTKGLPNGWNIAYGYFSKNDGIDGSMSLWGNTMDNQMYVTNYTQMGSSPRMSFYYKLVAKELSGATETLKSDMVTFYVEVSTDGGRTWDKVYTVSPTDNPYTVVDGFTRVDIDLSQYANKTCLVRFNVPSYYSFDWSTFAYITVDYTFDNIEVGTKVTHDMSVRYLYGDRNYRVGEQATMNVVVRNSGTDNASGYTVRLVKQDGTVVATASGPELAAEQMATVAVTWTPDKAECTSIYAEVVLADDGDAAYNKSDLMGINILPATTQDVQVGTVTDLSYGEPFSFYFKEVATQSIYQANDLGVTAGTILGLNYKVSSPNEYIAPSVQIWMGEVEKSDFSDGEFVSAASLTKVYEGNVYLPDTTSGEVCIPLSTPYEYHGGNLVVYVFRSDPYFLRYRLFYAQEGTARTINISSDTNGATPAEDPQQSSETKDVENYYPIVEFLIDVPQTGVLYGQVTNQQGTPLANATISVKGTQVTTTTDEQGNYSFSAITYGEHELVAVCKGYRDATVTVTVNADSVRQDIVMTPYDTYTVKGVVTDAQTNGTVSGALVRLIGYDNFITTTDANGNYEIKGVYGVEGSDYQAIVTAPYYKDLTTQTVAVTADVTANFALTEHNFPVRKARSSASDKVATIYWNEPLPEYRHDSGIPNGKQRGFTYVDDLSTAVLGATYRHATTLYDIEWYLTSEGGPHDQVNIILFELTETGEPSYNVFYKKTVASNDNEWNYYELPTPVAAPYGFCVSLSYSNGYLGLSESNPTADYPTVTRTYYYNNNYDYSYTDGDGKRLVTWNDCAGFMDNALMLRAVGEGYATLDNEFLTTDIDGSRDAIDLAQRRIHQVEPVSYTIYRLMPGQAQSEWEFVATGITKLEYDDLAFGDLPTGDYQYAIIANYLNGDSDYRLTNILAHTSGVTELNADDASMLTDGNVYTVDGRLVSTNGTAGLDAGIYIMNGQKIAIIK